MSRAAIAACSAVVLAVAASARGQQSFGLHPGITTIVSRGSLGNAAGELLQAFPSTFLRGLGETASGAELRGMTVRVQDSNGSSAETFSGIVRSGDDVRGPTPAAAGLIAAIGPITTPTAGSTLPVAWSMTLLFTTPLATPRDAFLCAGVEFGLRQTGVDSLFLHGAGPGSNGEHPNTPDVAWQIPLATGVPSHPPLRSTWRIDLLLPSNAFRVANVPGTGTLPLYGIGGAYPDTTAGGPETQGIAFACAHGAGAQGSVYVFAAFGFDPSPSVLPGFANRVLLDPSTLVRAAVARGTADGLAIPYLQAGIGALPVGLGASVMFQALVIEPATATLEFTNAFATTLL
ncbi:MAG: hypothetical protein HZB39_18870 [Planctomycetes bacterium]|nr:hypothetical protein [Planctomycetota bacterium]